MLTGCVPAMGLKARGAVRYGLVNRRARTLLSGALPVAVLSAVMLVPEIPGTNVALTVPFVSEGPGPTFDTLGDVDGQPVVSIEGAKEYPTSGHLNMTTVSVRSGLTLSQAFDRWLRTDDDMLPLELVFPRDKTEEEVHATNQAAFSTSEASATIAAMRYLHRPVEVEVAGLVAGTAAEHVLREGDRLLAINGEDVEGPAMVQETIGKLQPGDTVELKVRRGKQTITQSVELQSNPHERNKALLGVQMAAAPANGVQVEYHLNDIGGPSAGLMFSMAVVDKLEPRDITGGSFVAGTGTIDDDGTVGPIGGITHKIAAASEAGAQVFLAPEDNCAEALSRSYGSTEVLAVRSLDDAIEQLDAYHQHRDPRTCAAVGGAS